MGLFKCLGFRVEKDRSERDLMRPTPFFVGQFDPLVCQDDLVLVGRNESLFVLEELHMAVGYSFGGNIGRISKNWYRKNTHFGFKCGPCDAPFNSIGVLTVFGCLTYNCGFNRVPCC
jgi:hypothetical protein